MPYNLKRKMEKLNRDKSNTTLGKLLTDRLCSIDGRNSVDIHIKAITYVSKLVKTVYAIYHYPLLISIVGIGILYNVCS